MRLISVHTEELVDFPGVVPPYAILSHRWSGIEPTYQQYRDDRGESLPPHSMDKIRYFCQLVKDRRTLMYGLPRVQWIWVDTVCIDKTNSAELSEAINSMWNWYKRAKWCVAYLFDVKTKSLDMRVDIQRIRRQIESSEWFRRGWTLQELLAPQRVVFYSREWTYLGSKTADVSDTLRPLRDPFHLASLIAKATAIDSRILTGERPIQWATVAQRMSWASRRSTSRPEDAAYCLLGLFDLNMPLLYGEGGPNAFRRLQEAILHKSDDDSIFAFRFGSIGAALADAPENFKGCESIERVHTGRQKSYTVAHQRLILSSPAIQVKNIGGPGQANRRQCIIRLDCVDFGPVKDPAGPACHFELIGLEEVGDQFRRRQGIVNAVKDLTKAEVDEKVRQGEWTEVKTMNFSIPISWRATLWRRGRHDLRAPRVQTFTDPQSPYFGGRLISRALPELQPAEDGISSDEERAHEGRRAFLNLIATPNERRAREVRDSTIGE